MSTIQRTSTAAMLLACALAMGCHEGHRASSGNSNWLNACDANSDCKAGFACICGLCSEPLDGATMPRCGDAAAPSVTPAAGPEAGLAGAGGSPADASAGGCNPAVESCGPDSASPSAPDAGSIRAFQAPNEEIAPAATSCEAGALLVDTGAIDEAWALALTEDSLLAAGRVATYATASAQLVSAWRIEQRSLQELALLEGFGDDGAVTLQPPGQSPEQQWVPRAMAVDATSLYTAGLEWDGEFGLVRVDKRSLESGEFVSDFGAGGVIHTEGSLNAMSRVGPTQGILVDGPHLYVTGPTFAVEKRYADDGALVAEFGAAGTSQSSAPADSIAQVLALRDGVLYVAGSNGFAGVRLEARNAQTSEVLYEVVENPSDVGCDRQGYTAVAATDDALYLVGTSSGQWYVERRRRSDGELIYAHDLPQSGNCDSALALAIDDTAMYVAGGNGGSWRVEKRVLADGRLVGEFGAEGVIMTRGERPNGAASAMVLRDGVLYVAGRVFQFRETRIDWRIERRSAADGSLIECPDSIADVPWARACSSPQMPDVTGPLPGADCAVHVASSAPCTGTNVRAGGNETTNADWRLHYGTDTAEDWGLAGTEPLTDQPSSYLVARAFGFALPDDARVVGIALEVTRDAVSEASIEDHAIRLVKGGQILDGDRSLSGAWAAGPLQRMHGGQTDLWDSTWTVAELNDPSFGVALRVHALKEQAGGHIDDLRVSVYYCE